MMFTIHGRSVLAIVKKEFMDSVRNKWIIAMSGLFAAFGILLSYFGSAYLGDVGFQGFEITIFVMLTISLFLVPIIALMLGYSAIVGERERGSLDLLLTMPISRGEVFVSKYVGLSLVLFVSIFVGFGLAGVVIAATAGTEMWVEYILFLGATYLLGLVFLALAMWLSVSTRKRSTAMGMAILLWFVFAIIWDIVVVGIAVGTGSIESFMTGDIPDWYFLAESFNPSGSYNFLTTLIVGFSEFPGFVTSHLILTIMLAWIILPITFSLVSFVRKDA